MTELFIGLNLKERKEESFNFVKLATCWMGQLLFGIKEQNEEEFKNNIKDIKYTKEDIYIIASLTGVVSLNYDELKNHLKQFKKYYPELINENVEKLSKLVYNLNRNNYKSFEFYNFEKNDFSNVINMAYELVKKNNKIEDILNNPFINENKYLTILSSYFIGLYYKDYTNSYFHSVINLLNQYDTELSSLYSKISGYLEYYNSNIERFSNESKMIVYEIEGDESASWVFSKSIHNLKEKVIVSFLEDFFHEDDGLVKDLIAFKDYVNICNYVNDEPYFKELQFINGLFNGNETVEINEFIEAFNKNNFNIKFTYFETFSKGMAYLLDNYGATMDLIEGFIKN